MPLSVGVSRRCDRQGSGMGGHVETVSKQRHGSSDIAGNNLANHHRCRKGDYPERPPGVFIVR